MQRNVRDYVPSYVLVLVCGKHSTATGRNARVGKTATNGERYKNISETETERSIDKNIESNQTQKCRPRHRDCVCVLLCGNRIELNSNSYC